MITTDRSTPSSPRCRCGDWPTPRCPGPASSAPSTPTSGSSGSGASTSACRDGRLPTLSDGDDTRPRGPGGRATGTWGFAAGVDLTADAAARVAAQAVEVARVAAAMNTERIELADEPGLRRRHLGRRPTRSIRSRCPTRTRSACWPTGPSAAGARRRRATCDASLQQVQGEQVLRRPAGTTTTQQRVRLHPELDRDRRRPVRRHVRARCARSPRRSAAAGST